MGLVTSKNPKNAQNNINSSNKRQTKKKFGRTKQEPLPPDNDATIEDINDNSYNLDRDVKSKNKAQLEEHLKTIENIKNYISNKPKTFSSKQKTKERTNLIESLDKIRNTIKNSLENLNNTADRVIPENPKKLTRTKNVNTDIKLLEKFDKLEKKVEKIYAEITLNNQKLNDINQALIDLKNVNRETPMTKQIESMVQVEVTRNTTPINLTINEHKLDESERKLKEIQHSVNVFLGLSTDKEYLDLEEKMEDMLKDLKLTTKDVDLKARGKKLIDEVNATKRILWQRSHDMESIEKVEKVISAIEKNVGDNILSMTDFEKEDVEDNLFDIVDKLKRNIVIKELQERRNKCLERIKNLFVTLSKKYN